MPGFGSMRPSPPMGRGAAGQPPTPTTPMGPPPHMQGPPPGWTGPPPPGWKGPPPPGFGPPQGGPVGPPTPEHHGQTPQGGPPPSAMPNFYGMAPAHPPAPLPASYENSEYHQSPKTPNTPYPDLNNLPAAYEDAIVDWNNISAAHAAVAQILANTDSFAPLPADLYPPVPGGANKSNMTPFGPALVHRSYDISVLWTLLHLAKIILLRSHPAMPPAAQMAAGVCAQSTQPYAMLIGRITAGMQIPLGENLSPFLGAVLTESTMSLFFAGVQFQDPSQREWLVTRLLEIDRKSGWASSGIIARGCETAWERAASMGRGPPYSRRTRRLGVEGPLVLDRSVPEGHSNWRDKEGDDGSKGGRIDERRASVVGQEGQGGDGDERRYGAARWGQGDGSEKRSISGDTRYVVKSGLSPWAMNLLGTDEDLRAGLERVGL